MNSGLELGMASELDAVRLEIVEGMMSELEKALGMPWESKSIGHICFDEIYDV
jgi:hypothetical protein